MLILILHPFFQALAILLAFYGSFLGLQRTRSLHFGQQDAVFRRTRHALVGGIALFMLLGGMASGVIITDIAWQEEMKMVLHLHKNLATVISPFLITGIATGLFLYFKPAARRVLPAVHATNNLILLFLLLYQAYSGYQVFLKYVLNLR